MRLFTKDAGRPGNQILALGTVTYVVVVLLVIGLSIVKHQFALSIVILLFALPLTFLLLMVLCSPALFVYGLLASVPGVSIVYGFQVAKRNWRGLAGAALLGTAGLVVALSANSTW
jgi:hypothetical protein